MEKAKFRLTCFKKETGTCIDLIITNRPKSHQFTGEYETGCSDHHLLIYTMLKAKFSRLPPKKIVYRDYTNFNQNNYLKHLKEHVIGEV